MADRFIPLRDFLVDAIEPEVEDVESVTVPVEESHLPACDAFGDVRRFRAAVRDAVDVTVCGVLCDVAAGVLARELALAPANLKAIVEGACERHLAEGVVRVRVHPDEASQIVDAGVAFVSDPALRRGDILLEARSGTIDVSLGARLAGVLDAIAS